MYTEGQQPPERWLYGGTPCTAVNPAGLAPGYVLRVVTKSGNVYLLAKSDDGHNFHVFRQAPRPGVPGYGYRGDRYVAAFAIDEYMYHDYSKTSSVTEIYYYTPEEASL